MTEITVDHLNETREMGLPFPFSAIAQFIPVNEKLCKVICLFDDGSWDSRSFDINLEADLLREYGLESELYVTKETLIDRIVDSFMTNYAGLIYEVHKPGSSDFKDMDCSVFNFSTTLKEMNDWLESHLADIYLTGKYSFGEEEIQEINNILTVLHYLSFDDSSDKKRFWEDILIISREYFPGRDTARIENFIKYYDRISQEDELNIF